MGRRRNGTFNHRSFRDIVKPPELVLPAWLTNVPLQNWWEPKVLNDIRGEFKPANTPGVPQTIASSGEDATDFYAHFSCKNRKCTFDGVHELMEAMKKMHPGFNFGVEHDRRGGGTFVLTSESYRIFTEWVKEYPHILEILHSNATQRSPSP